VATTKILDEHGNPIDMAALLEPQTEQPGAAGSSHVGWLKREWDAHPGRALTPLRLNAILQQAEAGNLIAQLELADDMEERDGQIYSELAKRKTAVTTLQWDVEPPDDASPDEQKTADQVRDWLKAIPCFEEDILLELMDAVLKGFKPIEMWWELDQGTLQPRFEARPQRWLCLDEDRDSLNLRDGSTQFGVPLQPYGWLLHMHRSRNGYLARAPLARVLAWPYLFKHYAVRDLAEFLEIYGLPMRLGKYPTGASDDEKRKLLAAVVSIGHNAGGVIPQSMAIDFASAAQGNEKPFETMWKGMDALQSKIILGQTLSSSEGQNGTQALGTVHNEVRIDILKSDAKRVAATLTSQLIKPMVLFNISRADPRRLPRFCLDVPEPEDIKLYADSLPKLAGAGMRIGVKDMHRRLRIEEAEDGEEILKGPPAPVAPGAAGGPAGPGATPPRAGNADLPPGGKTAPAGTPAAAAAKEPKQPGDSADLAGRTALAARNFSPAELAADAARDPTATVAHRLEGAGQPAWARLLDQVKTLVDQAGSLAELQGTLVAAYGDLDSTELVKLMAAAYALAELKGMDAARQDAQGAPAHG
jgi:phage gp29-like protein